MNFAEYLLEREFVSSDDLLDALIKQQQALPTVAETIREGDLLSTEDQLQIFYDINEHGGDYVTAARRLGLWNETIVEKVGTVTTDRCASLTDLLVKGGALTIEALTAALDEFVAEVEVPADQKTCG